MTTPLATTSPDDFVTAAEVALMLRVARTTVYDWVRKGILPAVVVRGERVGTVRIRRSDAERLATSQPQR